MTTPSEAVRVAVQALRELVALEDLKKQTEALHFAGAFGTGGENWHAQYTANRKDYIRRLPLAWVAARDALAALSLHVGDAADTSDALGASASPTACSGPLAPEPLRVSALRVPPAGAGGESDATTCNRSGG